MENNEKNGAAMLVAVTSQNFKTVTGHAGKTRRFLIYEVQPGAEPEEVDRLDLPKEMSMHAFEGPGSHPVESVDALVTGGCGPGFPDRMNRLGVRLVVTDESDPKKAAGLALGVNCA